MEMKRSHTLSALTEIIDAELPKQDIVFARLNSANFKLADNQPFPTIDHSVLHIFIVSGSAEVTIDNQTHHCTANDYNLISVNPVNTLTDLRIGNDFDGYVLAMNNLFFDNSMSGNRLIMIHDILETRMAHVFKIEPTKMARIARDCEEIIEEHTAPENQSDIENEILKHRLLILHFISIGVIFANRTEPSERARTSRKQLLVEQFTDLICNHVAQCHQVGFYADKLCITAQYLTKISNEVLGESANRVIDRELLSRAVVMLRSDQISIQQISNQLGFYDQSSFSKFFKKHTDTTPAAFRKQIN